MEAGTGDYSGIFLDSVGYCFGSGEDGEMKKEVVSAPGRCALCNLTADKQGNTLKAAQAERHHHFLEFRTSAELAAHLKANNDAAWVASGGVDAVVTWWFGRKGGQTWVSRST